MTSSLSGWVFTMPPTETKGLGSELKAGRTVGFCEGAKEFGRTEPG